MAFFCAVGWLPMELRRLLIAWGLALFAAGEAKGQTAVPAPAEIAPRVSLWAWHCPKEPEDDHAQLEVGMALRQLPAVSEDGTLALGVQELVRDSESDLSTPPIVKVSPEIIWRAKARVVVYFVDLARNRAQAPIGLLSEPLNPPGAIPCAALKQRYQKNVARVNGRLRERPWARLRPLARNLREPEPRIAEEGTRQRRKIGNAGIVFRYPFLTITWGDHREKVRLPMAGYPGRTMPDEPFGFLDLQPRGSRTWLTDVWIEPRNGVLVMRLMNTQLADCVLGNAFTYFYKLSSEQVAALCPECRSP
jgi:hypothetical protein